MWKKKQHHPPQQQISIIDDRRDDDNTHIHADIATEEEFQLRDSEKGIADDVIATNTCLRTKRGIRRFIIAALVTLVGIYHLSSQIFDIDSTDYAKQANGKVALVTGSAGFIGSHVVHYCAEYLNMKVIAVDNLSGGNVQNVFVHDNVSFIRGDVTDALFLEDLFRRFDIDYVYHLAAYAALGLSPFIRSYNYRNNMIGTTEIINAIVKSQHKVECLIFTSSNAVYGEGQYQSESTIPEPNNPYGIAKYSSELDIRSAHETWGMESVILRLHNVYGPNQNIKDKYRNAIGVFLNQALSGKNMTIFGSGTQTRQFTYISDIAPLIAKSPFVSAARNEVINAGAGTPYTLNEVAQSIQNVFREERSLDPSIQHVDALQEVQHANVHDHNKLQKLFKKTEFVSLEEGLKLTIDSLNCTDTDGTQGGLNAVEVIDQMPPTWITDNLEQRAVINLQGQHREYNKPIENECDGTTIAVMISGQFNRFIFKEMSGPMVAASSSTCGNPIIDVYIVLHRGKVTKPWTGEVSTPPYINDNITILDIEQYYKEKRGANEVFVQFVDDDYMKSFDDDLMGHFTSRRLPKEYLALVNEHYERRIFASTRWIYLRHLVYSMAVKHQKTYSIYVSQREDALFLEPLNFTSIGFDTQISTQINGEPIKSQWYSDLKDARSYIFLEKWCKFSSYSDKIHIGNDVAMATLWGKTWLDFVDLMIRYTDFGYAKQGARYDPFQTEAYIQDLLHNATVNEVDLKRVDMRYVNGKRCVPKIYHKCQPQATKEILSSIEVSVC